MIEEFVLAAPNEETEELPIEIQPLIKQSKVRIATKSASITKSCPPVQPLVRPPPQRVIKAQPGKENNTVSPNVPLKKPAGVKPTSSRLVPTANKKPSSRTGTISK